MSDVIQKNMEGPEIEAILGQGITIPPQPKVLLEIEEQASRPRVNVKAIAKLVAQDPALLAGVFRVVNSPAMGLSRKVDSAETAITLLGLKQVTNLLKSLAIRQALGGNSLAYEKFWERSGDIAQLCALIAQRQVSVCNVFPDQAYMAGLFHDCGVIVLMQRFPEYGNTLDFGCYDTLDLVAADKQFNTDHCVVGYLVGKHWRLPEFILRGIRFHHEGVSVSHPASVVVAILQMATHLYNILLKRPDDSEWLLCQKDCVEELGVGEDGLREFEEEMLEQFGAGR